MLDVGCGVKPYAPWFEFATSYVGVDVVENRFADVRGAVEALPIEDGGFDVVLSNPPWDIMQQNAGEFLAALDLAILDAPTRREARAIQDRLLAVPATARAFRRYQAGFQQVQFGTGALYGIILFVIMVVVGLVQLRLIRPADEEA